MAEHLNRAADLLARHNVVLFCGAGISQDPPAGLPDWHDLRDLTIDAVGRRDPVAAGYVARLTSVEMLAQSGKRGMTPELVASVLAESSPAYFESLRALHDGDPNANHARIAALAAQSSLRYIVTTNFDQFLERALERAAVTFRTYRSATEFRAFGQSSAEPIVHLLKIHGCISEPATITATVEQEGGGLKGPIRDAIEQLVAAHWFLFWGYSGADLKIDLDYLGMVSLADRAPGFFWSTFRSGDHEEMPHPLVVQLAGLYGERAVIAPNLGPEVIDLVLPPEARLSPVSYTLEARGALKAARHARLAASLDEWAIRHIDAMTSCRAIGELLNVEAARLEAIACYQRMGELAHAAGATEREARAAILESAAFRELGQFVDAYQKAKTAERLARDSGSWMVLYSALFEYGTLCSAWGRHADALAAFREAETLVRQQNAEASQSEQMLPLDLREGLARCYFRLGYGKQFLEQIDLVERLTRETGDKRSLCRILNLRMVSQLEFGEWHDAIKTGEDWRALATVLGYRKDMGYALVNLAVARMATSDDDGAWDDLEAARRLAVEEPGERLEMAVHSLTASWQASHGRPDLARTSLDGAIAISRRLQADHETAAALASSASLAAKTSLPVAERIALFDEALRLFEATGDAQRAAQTAEEIGDVYANEPDGGPTAIAYYRRAMAGWRLRNIGERADILQEKLQRIAAVVTGTPVPPLLDLLEDAAAGSQPIRDVLLADARSRPGVTDATLPGLAASLNREFGATAGVTLMRRLHHAGVQAVTDRQPRVAAQFHSAAHRIAKRIHDLQTAGIELNEVAVIAAGEQAFVAARQIYEQSLSLAQETGNHREQATVLFNLGTLAVRMGQADEALSWFARAVELARTWNLPYELAVAAQSLGGLHRDRREFEEARKWFEQAEPILREMGEMDDLIGALQGLGKVYRELSLPAQSVQARLEAARLLEAQGKKAAAAPLYVLAGNSLLKDLHQPDQARAALTRALELAERAGMSAQVEQARRLLEESAQPDPGPVP